MCSSLVSAAGDLFLSLRAVLLLRSLFFTVLVLVTASAFGATFQVDSTADLHDADLSDGVCQASNGDCTLRAAIEQADESAAADTVEVPSGTYALTEGELVIHTSMTIRGEGATTTIIRNDAYQQGIIYISDSEIQTIDVELRDLTIQEADERGITNVRGNLEVIDCIVKDNQATDNGAGILNAAGTLLVLRSTIDGNDVLARAGGIDNTSNGGEAPPYCEIRDSTISGNTANHAGAVRCLNGSLYVVDSTISGNHANFTAGGILVSDTFLVLRSATIAFNDAFDENDEGGAGVRVIGSSQTCVTHTIVAGNWTGSENYPEPSDFAGHINYWFFNLFGSADGVTAGYAYGGMAGTNAAPIDPLLAPLAGVFGKPKTHAIPFASPARDTGWNGPANDPRSASMPIDQRGHVRPWLGGPDIGAYEHGAPEGDTGTEGFEAVPPGSSGPGYTAVDSDGDGLPNGRDFVPLSRLDRRVCIGRISTGVDNRFDDGVSIQDRLAKAAGRDGEEIAIGLILILVELEHERVISGAEFEELAAAVKFQSPESLLGEAPSTPLAELLKQRESSDATTVTKRGTR